MYFRKIISFLKSQTNNAVLVKGSFVSLLLRVTSAGIVFILHVILARLLGIKDYGSYAYITSWITLLVYFSKSGTDISIVKLLPEYQVHERWSAIKGLLIRSRQLILGLSLSIIFITFLIIYFNRDRIGKEESSAFLIALGMLPLLGMIAFYTATLRAFKAFFKALAPASNIWPLALILLLIFYYQINDRNVNVSEAMALNLLALFIAAAISRHWGANVLPLNVKKARTEFHEKQWLRIALPLFIISGAHLILSRADVIMLGMFSSEKQVALYAVASRVSELVLFGMSATETIIAPLIAQLYAKQNLSELQRIITFSTRGVFLFTAFAGLFLLIFGKFVLSFFGQSFIESYLPLSILLAGFVIKVCIGFVIPLMMMSAYQKQAMVIISLSAVLNILLNLLLIPRYGSSGAAIATVTTITLSNIGMAFYVVRKLAINPSLSSRQDIF